MFGLAEAGRLHVTPECVPRLSIVGSIAQELHPDARCSAGREPDDKRSRHEGAILTVGAQRVNRLCLSFERVDELTGDCVNEKM
jgi:hypothetical protein